MPVPRWFYEFVFKLFQQVEVETYLHNIQTDVRGAGNPTGCLTSLPLRSGSCPLAVLPSF
jgi:hypothetical protein